MKVCVVTPNCGHRIPVSSAHSTNCWPPTVTAHPAWPQAGSHSDGVTMHCRFTVALCAVVTQRMKQLDDISTPGHHQCEGFNSRKRLHLDGDPRPRQSAGITCWTCSGWGEGWPHTRTSRSSPTETHTSALTGPHSLRDASVLGEQYANGSGTMSPDQHPSLTVPTKNSHIS